ncbi:ubiquitin-specific protease ubp15, partial [Linderina macrospora]
PGLSKPGLTNLVHLKFYDGAKDRIVGLGHFRLSFFKKLRLSFPDLCKIADLPRGTQLLLFEEVKPGEIRKLDSEWTLKYAGLGPGDIICFQVKPDGYDGMSRYQRGKFPSVVSFFGRKAK